jgi:hypothetical protein
VSLQQKESNVRSSYFLLVLFLAPHLLGCSSQQLYNTGQAWQRNQCDRLLDEQERRRCAASTDTPYDDYKRQSEEVKGAK